MRRRCAWRGDTTSPDPAVGSSGVSGRQSRFDGSDRQARGRLMKALARGPVAASAVAAIMQRDDVTAQRLLAALVDEGLCESRASTIALPR